MRNAPATTSQTQQPDKDLEQTPRMKHRNVRPSTASHHSQNRSRWFQGRQKTVQKSYGNFGLQQTNNNEDEKQNILIEALGKLVNKNIKQGKGLSIPKLGQFTFTGTAVDLGGLTNPQLRDNQERFPVFLIGKDFPCSVTIQQGIASGMTLEMFGPDGQHKNQTNHIRIYGNQGQAGIIPKVKLNLFELSGCTNGQLSKDDCKIIMECFIRRIADMVNNGRSVDEAIPHVGRLVIKNGVCAVNFNKDIIEEARFQTAKNYDQLFGKNNWMNGKIYEQNKTNYGMQLTNIDYSDTPLQRFIAEYNDPKTNDEKRSKDDNTAPHTPSEHYSQSRTANQKQRALSAVSIRKSQQSLSRVSQPSTFISRVPELAPFQLMTFANEIYSRRQAIINFVQGSSKITMRETLSASQIQKVLKKVGYNIMIPNLKAIMKELGFEWNGKSTSMLQLINSLKNYTNPESKQQNEQSSDLFTSIKQVQKLPLAECSGVLGLKKKDGHSVIERIKDLFYYSGQTLYSLFKQATQTATLSPEQFQSLISSLTDTISKEDCLQLYEKLVKIYGRDKLSYKEFEEALSHLIPRAGSQQFETLVIKKIRDWMFSKQYNTKSAFERLTRSVDRLKQYSMKRVDFHQAIIINRILLSAPEIDFLFDFLVGSEFELTFDHWTSRIYDDNQNPLQLIREVIHCQHLDIDEVLFQMKLKIWDDPIDYAKFSLCLKRLDPTFSENQCQALFSKLKSSSEDKVDVQVFLNNLCGTHHDTVDYKNKMFKQLYSDIFNSNKQEALLKAFEQSDQQNDGKVNSKELLKILQAVTVEKYSEEELVKFIRQLKKDEHFKINYVEFMDRITIIGNREHNPFKTLMHRFAYFLDQNKISVANLLIRLSNAESPLTIQKFADFLKQKIEKKKNLAELNCLAQLVDVDKDGIISEEDLYTCLRNLSSSTFYKNNGELLSVSSLSSKNRYFMGESNQRLDDKKLLQVCKQVRDALLNRGQSLLALWRMVDKTNQGLINLSSFIKGVNLLIPMASSILEKVFVMMDQNQIGLVDYDKFHQVLNIETTNQIPRPNTAINDNFKWQEDIIEQVKKWIKIKKLNSEEAFRCFDLDVSGEISKSAFKRALVEKVGVPEEEVTSLRLDRLFKLLSFFKSETLQLSDFERMFSDTNPYQTAATGSTSSKFASSMGGSLASTSTFNWKYAAIQQIGQVLSKHYPTLEQSFNAATDGKPHLNFQAFKLFVDKHHALAGFNMTAQLMQQVYAELDPHKKAYVTIKDWASCFGVFSGKDTSVVEFKHYLQCKFRDVESVFQLVRQHASSDEISLDDFTKACTYILGKSKAAATDTKLIFNAISQNNATFSREDFVREFSNVTFKGTSKYSASTASSTNKRSHSQATRTQSEVSVLERMKGQLKNSGKCIEIVFKQFDFEHNGLVSKVQFKRALRLLNLGLSEADITSLLDQISESDQGLINYKEFTDKFKDAPAFEVQMRGRAQPKLAHLKQLMKYHMTSTTEAFRMFDSTNSNKLSFADFNKLLNSLYQLAGEEVPGYSVLQDLFDIIDANQDGALDFDEWNLAFNQAKTTSSRRLVSNGLCLWENSFEATKFAVVIAKNRKLLLEHASTQAQVGQLQSEKYLTFSQAKAILNPIFAQTLKQVLPDNKLEQLLSVAQAIQQVGPTGEQKIYDFAQLINIMKNRHMGPQFKQT